MKGKQFEDRNGNTFTVVDVDGNIAKLNDGNKVAIERLMDKAFFSEKITVDSFQALNESSANNRHSALANKLNEIMKNGININNIPDSPEREVKIMQGEIPVMERKILIDNSNKHIPPTQNVYTNTTTVNEKDELMRKAQRLMEENKNRLNSQNKTLSQFANIDDIDQKILEQANNQKIVIDETGTTEIRQPYNQNNTVQPILSVVDNQVERLFNGIKRTNNFSFDLNIKDKIPDKNVIKMWEDSYSESFIEYLANNMYNNLMQNPAVIKDAIVEKLKTLVYTKKKRKTPKKDV